MTDENIDPAVVTYLRQLGFNVRDVMEDNLIGSSDRDLLALAVSEGRVVVTHDSDLCTLATRLDQSILAKAFRGELVPQDPNDEPASVLFERIRQQREATAGKKKDKQSTSSRGKKRAEA